MNYLYLSRISINRSYLLGALGALVVVQAHQLKAQESPQILETVIVSAKHTSPSLLARQVIVNREENFALGARLDPAELLQMIPGVQVDSRTNYAQDTRISLRGFGARSAFGVRGIDLQIDGIPMSTPDGQGQLASAMLDNIASAQVLRGPIAALYGNSSGGVIALQSPVPQRSKLSASIAAGDNGLARQTLNGEWRKDNLALRGQFANADQDGERPHSRAERQQAGIQFFYSAPNDIDVMIKHDNSDDPLLQDPLGLTPAQWRDDPTQTSALAEEFDTRKRVAHRQTSISLRDNTGATRWQTSLWQGKRAITQYLGFAGDAISSSGGVVDLEREFSGASGTFTQSFSLLGVPTDISVGAEFAQMEDNRRGYVNDFGVAGDLRRNETGDVKSRDIYSVIQIFPTEKITFYTGARQSDLNFDVTDFFIVPSTENSPGNPDDSGTRDYREQAFAFGANYSITSEWELFASSGRGYETPTLTEMAYKSDGTGLNTALEAAINDQQEWGIRYYPDTSVELTLTQFFIDTENELVVDQSRGGRTSYRNAAATERQGVEFLGRYTFTPEVRVQFSAQSLDAIYSAGQWSQNQLPGVAREQYQLDLHWLPFASDLLQLRVGMQQRSRIYTADNNEAYAPAYRTWDVGAQGVYLVNQIELDWWLKLANLSDENYVGSVIVNQSNGRSFEPALGRNLSAGIQLTF